MLRNIFLFSFIIYPLFCLKAQVISGKVVDNSTLNPISYATIKYGENKGVITNEEGEFSINIDTTISESDSLHISYIGYAKKSYALLNYNSDTIHLEPDALELSTVFLTDKKLPPEVIIQNVKKNLNTNYSNNYIKHRFFMRESFSQYYKQFDFGFKKSSIEELTEELIDSIAASIPKRMAYYNETLGDFYSKTNIESIKLNVLKTSKLYDKNLEVSFDGLQEKLMGIFNRNVKKNSYLKIKSGILGTKLEVDSINNVVNNKDDLADEYEKKHYFDSRKKVVLGLTNRLFYNENSDLNIIHRPNKYEFKFIDYVEIDDELAYKLTFNSNRSSGLNGVLYVNTEDFAVLRIDYENAGDIYDKKFNMFGVNVNHVKYEGTMIFGKSSSGKYNLKYVNHRNLQSFKLDRPLTVIEKNKHVKGRRKQNELKLQMLFNLIGKSKKEIVVFESDETNSYNTIKENKTLDVKYFSKYTPSYWQGYNIMEPNQAIKEFTAIEAD